MLHGLNGRVSVSAVPAGGTLTAGERQDDYPFVCADGEGGAWAVWQSYEGEREQLHFARWAAGKWAMEATVSRVEGDLFKPVRAVDGLARLVVVWMQKTGDDWELRETTFDGATWT